MKKKKYPKSVEAAARLARYGCDEPFGVLRDCAGDLFTAGRFTGDTEANARLVVESLPVPLWPSAGSMFKVTLFADSLPMWRVHCPASQVVPLAADWLLRSVFGAAGERLDASWVYPVHCEPVDCVITLDATDGPPGVWQLSDGDDVLDVPRRVLVDLGLASWRSTLRVGRNHWDTLNRLDPAAEFELLPEEEGEVLPDGSFSPYPSLTATRAELLSGSAVLGSRVSIVTQFGDSVEKDAEDSKSPSDAAWFVAEALREALGQPIVYIPWDVPHPLDRCVIQADWFIDFPPQP